MKVGIPLEVAEGEHRVACVPDVARLLINAGLTVAVQAGAGARAHFPDEAYEAVGVEVVDRTPIADADAVLTVRPLTPERAASLSPGAITLGFLPPLGAPDTIRVLRDRRVTAFSMETLPRLSRAQAMDGLSSQALVAGYRAVLIAAQRLPRFLPMFTTAAGTVAPAKVLVMGAGVAGLQAIATARRLGAVVEAYDVRAAAAEEVRSLGARFVDLELETQEGTGGYAAAQSEDFLRRQRELLGRHVAASDVVITTAAVPGRRAPVLVTAEMIETMTPGSVIVDLAAESGGNVEGSIAGQDVLINGVTVHGAANVPSGLPVHASQLYSRNLANLLLLMTSDGVITPDFDDELIAGACLTHDGVIRHAGARELVESREGRD